VTATAAESRPRAGAANRIRVRLRDSAGGLLFTLPFLVLAVAFVVIPIGLVFYYSFTKYDGLADPEWVGLDNYKFLFEGEDFRRIIVNNLVLVAGLGLWIALPFVIAILIFGHPRANQLRALLFVPALLPPIIAAGMFRTLLLDNGPLNEGLRSLGLDALALPWLSDDKLVLVAVILVITWATVGTGVLFFTAGLSAISRSYIEAAVIDGARWHQVVWDIYRPALRPVTRFWALLLTVATVTALFPWIFALTKGGPGVASTTLDFQVYSVGISGGNIGVGSAVAVIGVMLIVVLLLLQYAGYRMRHAEEWTQ
jgi:ABC-type sugar transport system permease subunit